jgi:hypothetical protein
MDQYQFTKAKIAHWVERIGVDIRPPIESDLDDHRIQSFSKWARKKYPQLFDRVVVGNQRFEMLKTLEYPGKPAVDLTTFTMTPRGPVFMVPKRISTVDLEPDLPLINDVFGDCMRQFQKDFPGKRLLRVGKINEYIFDCGQLPSIDLVATRFSRIMVPSDGELLIRVNRPDSDYNRILTLEPVIGKSQSHPGAPLETIGFGVKVTVDLNNRNLRELTEPEWMTVLNAADTYNREGIYELLNNLEEEIE